MKKGYYFSISLLVMLAFWSIDNLVSWKIAPGYAIQFEGRKASGAFKQFKGDIVFDASDLKASRFDVQVEVASIDTGNKLKNKHARSSKWFDAERFPYIRFISSEISQAGAAYQVKGMLDLHGTRKEITIPFRFERDTFSGSFAVNRLDYGIGKSSGMSGKVGPDFRINIQVPVTRQEK